MLNLKFKTLTKFDIRIIAKLGSITHLVKPKNKSRSKKS